MSSATFHCPICKCLITEKNTARWGEEKDHKIRLDSQGKPWCQSCADHHDSVDWDEFYSS